MKTKGALIWEFNQPWSIEEIEIGDPVKDEVKIQMEASGMCHSDHHLVTGDIPMMGFPVLGGHEGAGIVTIAAPQPLSLAEEMPADLVAGCVGIDPSEVVAAAHRPVAASVGNAFVVAEVAPAALTRAAPDLARFKAAHEVFPFLGPRRLPLYLYAHDSKSADAARLRARMFAPLSGTIEDAATGSAATPGHLIRSMLAFLAGYVIGDKHLETRGVPQPLREPLLELRRRYSTRPGEADIKLVQELGLFDYLSRRLSICGNPQDCLAQALAAKAAGAKRLMLTVSLASDPIRTVELFGEHVLPKL